MNEIMTDTRTPIEIALDIDSEGMTTARKLYQFLGLAQGQFSRWAKINITDNEFAIPLPPYRSKFVVLGLLHLYLIFLHIRYNLVKRPPCRVCVSLTMAATLHPQLCVCPLLRLYDSAIWIFPQSHLHFQYV